MMKKSIDDKFRRAILTNGLIEKIDTAIRLGVLTENEEKEVKELKKCIKKLEKKIKESDKNGI